MSMNALHLQEARHRAGQRVSRGTGRGDVFASLPPADRITYARWMRAVAALYASLALLTAVSLFAFHERSSGHDAQTAGLHRAPMN
jgi:hypothetical protein